MNNFKDNFKNLRISFGLSQSNLAEKLKATQRKISYWESGMSEPSIQDLILIANFFDVSLDYLVGRSNY